VADGIVGGIRLVSKVTGELREAKVVTAVDDHSRYCVIAKVVERATGQAICLALAAVTIAERAVTSFRHCDRPRNTSNPQVRGAEVNSKFRHRAAGRARARLRERPPSRR